MDSESLILIERPQKSSFAPALKKHYRVTSVSSGKQAVEAARRLPPVAIVLDAISLRTTGERIAKQLKLELGDLPLIHLHPGAKAESPADVVLLHPFTARKLINSVARVARPPKQVSDDVLICGGFVMNVTRRLLVVNGQETQLTPKAALLAEIFLRHPDETLNRKQLMEHVWQTDYMGDTRTLDVHVRWLRRAIEADAGNPLYLKTVRGVGYRFEASASVLPTASVNGAYSTGNGAHGLPSKNGNGASHANDGVISAIVALETGDAVLQSS